MDSRILSIEIERQPIGTEPDLKSVACGVAGRAAEEVRGHAQGIAEQRSVRPVKPGKSGEGGQGIRLRGVGEGDLVLLREVGLLLSLERLRAVRSSKSAVAGRIVMAWPRRDLACASARARQGMWRRSAELRRIRDRRFLGGGVTGIREHILVSRRWPANRAPGPMSRSAGFCAFCCASCWSIIARV